MYNIISGDVSKCLKVLNVLHEGYMYVYKISSVAMNLTRKWKHDMATEKKSFSHTLLRVTILNPNCKD